MVKPSIYIPGSYPSHQGPLSRFLPPIPEGVVSTWLETTLPQGSLVLDPFGSLPRLPIEAARSGYRVIIAMNNPIAKFLLESLVYPPSNADFRAVIADLASSFRGQERLETHLRSIYTTQCENCARDIEAQAYIWERDADIPFAKQFTCPHCGESGIYPTAEYDAELAAHFVADKLHHARALERVASLDDPDRHHVEEALAMYLPRTLYAIFTMINRLDSLDISSKQRRWLEMLLLSTFDMANSLWTYPGGRSRPRQLTQSPRFYEKNVWMTLENAFSDWVKVEDQRQQISLTYWPDLPPPQGGVSIYEGRFKDLLEELDVLDIQGVVCAVPRPNQAYWTLSTLWAGWLWGKDSVRSLKSVLRRRRYDWNWHCFALHSIFENLSQVGDVDMPTFGMIGEVEPGFLTATIIAAESAGLSLREFALRAESSQAQLTWQKSSKDTFPKLQISRELGKIAAQAAQKYIIKRAEPVGYLHLHAAALVALAQDARLKYTKLDDVDGSPTPGDLYTGVTALIEQVFTLDPRFTRLGGSDKSLEVGQWWVTAKKPVDIQTMIPTADRVEVEVVQYLLTHPGSSLLDVDRAICSRFPGLLTPGGDLVYTCMESYAEQEPIDSDKWFIRREDAPKIRCEDIFSIQKALIDIGSRLGFNCQGDRPHLWSGDNDETLYVFYILASATFGELIQTCPYPATKSIIVIPGSRANLTHFKLKRNGYINQIVTSGWRFVKFRHVYSLLESPMLDRDNIDAHLDMDPLQDTTLQMRLL